MRDTDEQSGRPADSVERAGGGGLDTDDPTDGELQEQELELERETWGNGGEWTGDGTSAGG